MPRLRSRAAGVAAIVAAALLLTGCGAAAAHPAAGSSSPAADKPLVIQNCDAAGEGLLMAFDKTRCVRQQDRPGAIPVSDASRGT